MDDAERAHRRWVDDKGWIHDAAAEYNPLRRLVRQYRIEDADVNEEYL
jgi:hypothetical protein